MEPVRACSRLQLRVGGPPPGGGLRPRATRWRQRAARALVAAACALVPATIAAQGGPNLDQAAALVEAGRHGDAKPLLLALAKQHPGDAAVAYYLGRVFFAAEAYDESIRWLDKAVTRDPKSSRYRQWLGRAYSSEAGRATLLRKPSLAGKARTAFEQAVALDPENVDARYDLFEYYRQAPGVAGGSKAKAKEQADEIGKRDASRGHLARATLHEGEEDTAAAEREYLAAIEAQPSNAGAYEALGLLYARAQQYDRAFDVFDRGLTAKPGELPLLYQVGRTAALSARRLEAGAQALTAYLERAPASDRRLLAAAHWRLGMIREHQGAKDLARQEYESAVRIDPGRKEAAEALRRLRK